MIGDSRFARTSRMGIKMNNTEYIAASGQGYDWLMREAWPRLMEQIMNSTEEGKTAIVINLGVNDLLNYKKYIRFVNKDMLTFAHKYQCDVYYVSVNPVNAGMSMDAFPVIPAPKTPTTATAIIK